MSEEPENVFLQHLAGLRNELRELRQNMTADMADVKFRLRQLEETGNHHTTQFDRINERLSRIENRLDLGSGLNHR